MAAALAAAIGLGLGIASGMVLGTHLLKSDDGNEEQSEADSRDKAGQRSKRPLSGANSPSYDELLEQAMKSVQWQGFEQAAWLNSVIEWLWPHVTTGIVKLTESWIKAIKQIAWKPDFGQGALLNAVEFSLSAGDVPFQLGGIKVQPTEDKRGLFLEAPVVWGSSAEFAITVSVPIGSRVIRLPVRVQDVLWKGTVGMIVHPLVNTIPCTEGVTVFLTGAPFVDLSMHTFGGFDLMTLPLVHEALLFVLRTLFSWHCLGASALLVKGGGDVGAQAATGMLEVDVKSIKGLSSREGQSKRDPYVVLVVQSRRRFGEQWVNAGEGALHKTAVAYNTLDPVYNESFKIAVPQLTDEHVLVIRVVDYDIMGDDSLICEHRLPLDRVQPDADCKQDEQLLLRAPGASEGSDTQDEEDEAFGELSLAMQYCPFQQQTRQPTEAARGVLTVEIEHCSDLPILAGAINPFVEVRLEGGEEVIVQRTDLHYNDPNPRFRQRFDFVYVPKSSTVTITVFNQVRSWEIDFWNLDFDVSKLKIWELPKVVESFRTTLRNLEEKLLKFGRRDDVELGRVDLVDYHESETAGKAKGEVDGLVRKTFELNDAGASISVAYSWCGVSKNKAPEQEVLEQKDSVVDGDATDLQSEKQS